MRCKIILILSVFFVVASMKAQDVKLTTNINPTIDEGEADIVINPTDSNKMVVGFMAWGTNAIDFKAYTSDDAGDTWTLSNYNFDDPLAADFPGHIITGGGDIVFAYDKTGLLYCSFLRLLQKSNDTIVTVLYMLTSTDDGKTFSLEPGEDRFLGIGKIRPNFSVIYDYKDGFVDREWLAVDMSDGPNANKLYAGYGNFRHDFPFASLKVKTKVPGVSGFSDAVTAYSGTAAATNIMVDHEGVLHYTFADTDLNRIVHVSSSDGGQTFTAPHDVATVQRAFLFNSPGFINNREGSSPSLAIDGKNNLHLVWMDIPPGVFPKSYYSRSTDGGVTWSTPFDLSEEFDGNVYMPMVSSINNRVSIAAQVLDNSRQAESYILPSVNYGKNFGWPIKVSTGISNLSSKANDFIGDYNSSTRTNCYVYSTWTDCRSSTSRCKMYVSKTDECTFTGIQELTPLESTFSIASIYPNPVEDNLNLNVKSEVKEAMEVYVYNVDGKEMLAESRVVVKGDNLMNIGVGHLPSGPYILKLNNSENTFVTRLFNKR